MFGLKLSYSQW